MNAIPNIVLEHGLVRRYAAGDVSVETAPELDNPNRTICRARVVCSYDRLASRGAITEAQRLAADRYGYLREQETGASWRADSEGRSASSWQKGHPIHTALTAAALLREAHIALGPRARAVVHLLVVENMTAKDMAIRLSVREEQAPGLISAALERLVEHWEGSP